MEERRVLLCHEYTVTNPIRHSFPKRLEEKGVHLQLEIVDIVQNAEQWMKYGGCETLDMAVVHLRLTDVVNGKTDKVDDVIDLVRTIRLRWPDCRIGIETGLYRERGIEGSGIKKIFSGCIPDFVFTFHGMESMYFLIEQIVRGAVGEEEKIWRDKGYILTPEACFNSEGRLVKPHEVHEFLPQKTIRREREGG